MTYEAVILAVGTAVGAIVAAIAVNFGKVVEIWSKTKSDERAQKASLARDMEGRLQAHIDRLERDADMQQGMINTLHEEYTNALIEVSDLFGWLVRMRDIASRMGKKLKEKGEEPEEIPVLPSRQPRKQFDYGFYRRTEQHNANLVKAADEVLKTQMKGVSPPNIQLPPPPSGGKSDAGTDH